MSKQLLVVFFLVATLMAADKKKEAPAPDTIYVNGNVYIPAPIQGPPSDDASVSERAPSKADSEEAPQPSPDAPKRAQAFAVKGDRFTAVGTNDEIRKLKDKKTNVVDLQGKFVMPGFNDAHLHLASGGFERLNVDLTGTKSLEEMKERIARRVATAAPGEWIQGGGWDHTNWPESRLPSRQDIDAVTQGHPAIFARVDGHIAIANTAALQAAKIAKDSPNPEGGKIDRDSQGEATGILRESAWTRMREVIPKPTLVQRRNAIELALADAARWGITSMQDNSDWEDFLIYEELEQAGKLTARISEWLPFNEDIKVLEQHRIHHPALDPMLHTGMLKGFMDGSLGSRTAALLKPYQDDPQNSGLPQYEQDTLNTMAAQRVSSGFQLGFHAIGDRGVEMALDAFSEALRQARERNSTGRNLNDLRFRVEHAQVVSSTQFQRFKNMGVIASMQPNHLLTDMRWALDRLGEERARYSYAWREFLDNGVVLAFGTDYPVEPITPFRGVYAAVTRANEDVTQVYFPPQRITIDEAIRAYTTGSAFAEFAEHAKGTIAPGMLADFVVLDRDLTYVRPHDILGTFVLRTVVGGKTVYEAK